MSNRDRVLVNLVKDYIFEYGMRIEGDIKVYSGISFIKDGEGSKVMASCWVYNDDIEGRVYFYNNGRVQFSEWEEGSGFMSTTDWDRYEDWEDRLRANDRVSMRASLINFTEMSDEDFKKYPATDSGVVGWVVFYKGGKYFIPLEDAKGGIYSARLLAERELGARTNRDKAAISLTPVDNDGYDRGGIVFASGKVGTGRRVRSALDPRDEGISRSLEVDGEKYFANRNKHNGMWYVRVGGKQVSADTFKGLKEMVMKETSKSRARASVKARASAKVRQNRVRAGSVFEYSYLVTKLDRSSYTYLFKHIIKEAEYWLGRGDTEKGLKFVGDIDRQVGYMDGMIYNGYTRGEVTREQMEELKESLRVEAGHVENYLLDMSRGKFDSKEFEKVRSFGRVRDYRGVGSDSRYGEEKYAVYFNTGTYELHKEVVEAYNEQEAADTAADVIVDKGLIGLYRTYREMDEDSVDMGYLGADDWAEADGWVVLGNAGNFFKVERIEKFSGEGRRRQSRRVRASMSAEEAAQYFTQYANYRSDEVALEYLLPAFEEIQAEVDIDWGDISDDVNKVIYDWIVRIQENPSVLEFLKEEGWERELIDEYIREELYDYTGGDYDTFLEMIGVTEEIEDNYLLLKAIHKELRDHDYRYYEVNGYDNGFDEVELGDYSDGEDGWDRLDDYEKLDRIRDAGYEVDTGNGWWAWADDVFGDDWVEKVQNLENLRDAFRDSGNDIMYYDFSVDRYYSEEDMMSDYLQDALEWKLESEL